MSKFGGLLSFHTPQYLQCCSRVKSKNGNMNKKFSEHIVGQLSKEYLSRIPHHIAPSLNLNRLPPSNPATVSDLLLNEFPYSVTLPTPITPFSEQSSQVLNGIDPVTSLIRQKIKWESRREKLLRSIRADRGSKIRRTEKAVEQARVGESVALPRGVAMLARHIDSDPDPAFSGVYNWYYTGGTLASLEMNQDHYFVCSSPVNGEIRLCEGTANKIESAAAITVDYNQPIHQIVTNSKGAALRQLKRVHVLAAVNEEKNKPLLSKVQSVASEKDNFVSVALHGDSLDHYCTLSTKGSFRLWDTETAKNRIKVSCDKKVNISDCWGSLLYQDTNTILHTDRCCTHVYDIRAGLKRQTSWCPSKMLEPCQQLSLLLRSQQNPSCAFYVATSHQLLLLDSRYGFCQCWTHLMAAPPYVGCAQFIENNSEVVCLGSQVMAECVAVVNRWSGDGSGEEGGARSTCPPRILPSPADALTLARRRGLGLHPSFAPRCSMSLTGLAVVPSEGGLRLMRQSATGDMFAQVIARTADPECANVDEDWACAAFTPNAHPTPMNVTATEDLRPLLTVLSGEDPLPSRPARKARTGSGWKISKKYLEDCVDLMAEKILKVWEVEDEDEWLEDMEDIGQEDPEERVLNWLGAAGRPADNMAMADAADNMAAAEIANFTPKVEADDSEDDPAYESAEIYPSTSRHFLDQIKKEPEFDNTNSAWDFPLTQQVKRSHPSPTHSEEEILHVEKKPKTFNESFTPLTPAVQPAITKKTTSSVKKKFVPGF